MSHQEMERLLEELEEVREGSASGAERRRASSLGSVLSLKTTVQRS
jgi:hypothetical protein